MGSLTLGTVPGPATPWASLARDAGWGDQQALAEPYRRAWHRTLAAVRASCGWAEDAVAVGFALALERLDQIRDPTAVEAWLTGSAIRASADLARRRRRARSSGSPADLPPGAGQHGESAAPPALAGVDRAAMASSFDQLPDELPRLVHLRYVWTVVPAPVIAAVHGPALGAACNSRSERTSASLPQTPREAGAKVVVIGDWAQPSGLGGVRDFARAHGAESVAALPDHVEAFVAARVVQRAGIRGGEADSWQGDPRSD